MQFGLCYFPTHYGMAPGELAAAAEERGFESLLFCEHTHIPVSRKSPYPGGGELPKMYAHTYDPFVACTAAAAATRRLKVGTGVCLVVERDPITTAKEVASVDRLSGGRFLFGVGAGWNREEMANHGTDARVRMSILRERVEAMRSIWTAEEAEYHGDYVNFDPIWSYPKPIQSPLPVLVGGMGPTVEDRIIDFGDGWLAQDVTSENLDAFRDRVAKLQRRVTEAGRDAVEISLFAASSKQEMIERYAAAGVDRCLFLLPDGDDSEVTGKLDRLAERVF
ncbi:LLM class F420-dependent oxidoreductase [Mycobacterium saskatchewanense]|uniref:LLM class F420-dependent oxidoreductase n=1 Tax=Mycobacterium saskatchewanense TaxID=220927 RepID=A0AAJ3TTW4_9MYCO|nr:LLM class F420-dependent oxidoreductase [Mycobacterium saskatchewanense]ORW69071.1 LLM class F420-dependent oxidoreductase [Mycobacterium saskatchewanense]BBX61728.1 LLM class F420-dependent oxidoreductase [Mycobacterium saskatchewanense]